jgi:hypothetical protein
MLFGKDVVALKKNGKVEGRHSETFFIFFLHWKGNNITYFLCVFLAFSIKHAMRMHRKIFISGASLALPFLS